MEENNKIRLNEPPSLLLIILIFLGSLWLVLISDWSTIIKLEDNSGRYGDGAKLLFIFSIPIMIIYLLIQVNTFISYDTINFSFKQPGKKEIIIPLTNIKSIHFIAFTKKEGWSKFTEIVYLTESNTVKTIKFRELLNLKATAEFLVYLKKLNPGVEISGDP